MWLRISHGGTAPNRSDLHHWAYHFLILPPRVSRGHLPEKPAGDYSHAAIKTWTWLHGEGNENTTGFLNVACVAQMISCLAHKGIEGEALENTENNLTQVWVNSHIKHRRKTPIMFRHRCTVNYWMDRHFLTAATSGYHRYNGSTIKHFYHIE